MKCDECLAVLEEYFDGELNQQTSEQVTAHMSLCAECAEAFDALSEEQYLYARYQREVEVTPALWQGVQARIAAQRESAHAETEALAAAATAASGIDAMRRAPLSRLREALAAVLVSLQLNPALAASLAVVALCAAFGLFWLRHPAPTLQTSDTIARRDAATRETGRDTLASERGTQPGDADAKTNDRAQASTSIAPGASPDIDAIQKSATAPSKGATNEEILRHGATQVALEAGRKRVESPRPVALTNASARANAATPPEFVHDHPIVEETFVQAESVAFERKPIEAVSSATNNSSIEEAEVARHIEKAQMLLRSFRNASLADKETASTGDVAYEKRLSRELLSTNILLRRDAETEGNVPAERLLSSLEPFLLDIANLEDNPSHTQVRSIQERMKKQEIIAALQVY